MKLLRLKIDQPYRSLKSFNYEFKNKEIEYSANELICFVGLNGSGKSNIIEALSEIFCFLDLYHLNYKKTQKWAKVSPLSFELEYLLNGPNNKNKHIKIESKKNKGPELYEIDEYDTPIELPLRNLGKYLPIRIIGYSSGQNEIINAPYLKNQGFYSEEVKASLNDKTEIYDVEHTKSIFMDYDSSSLILLSTWLFLRNTKLKIFKDFLRIENTSSFRILINLDGGRIELTNALKNTVSKLEKCGLIFEKNEKDQKWKIDFIVNSATRKAFKEIFKTPLNFFTSIYKLNLLNALSLKTSERDFYTSKKSKDNLFEKPPSASKEEKVFCVDQLKLIISKPKKEIDYLSISDGEHQFFHIIGTMLLFNETNNLFLLDEPESHFNPKWRSHFVKILNEVSQNKEQEFVLATHSPYVVSGCRKENVLKFVRTGENINYTQPKRETFGNSFEALLRELFEVDSFISQSTKMKLKEIIKNKNIDEMENAALEFAESREKRLLYRAIREVENLKK